MSAFPSRRATSESSVRARHRPLPRGGEDVAERVRPDVRPRHSPSAGTYRERRSAARVADAHGPRTSGRSDSYTENAAIGRTRLANGMYLLTKPFQMEMPANVSERLSSVETAVAPRPAASATARSTWQRHSFAACPPAAGLMSWTSGHARDTCRWSSMRPCGP